MTALGVLCASPLYRAGLASLLAKMGFEHVVEGATTQELKQAMNGDITPEVVLVKLSGASPDSELPQAQIIAETMEQVCKLNIHSRVVFLFPELDIDLLFACFANGSWGFLIETISQAAFQESLRLVCAGEKVFPSGMATLLPDFASKVHYASPHGLDLGGLNLSGRELEILKCLTEGQSNKSIARNLDIAESTVKVHVKRILQKTNATNRTQAALWGVSRGLSGPN